MSEHLKRLAERVDSSASWRAEKAKQYPDDKRNERSSAALGKLAARLMQLSSDDEHASAYEEAMDRAVELDEKSGSLLYRITELETPYVGRYGFDYPQDGDPAPFLEGLTEEIVELAEAEEEERAKEEDEARYEAAREAADEEAKEAAHEAAREAAEEAAKEAAEQAYREAYDEAYKEAYDEAYREALIRALEDAP
jgi:DNA repair exonuclease SbcCD ATPase subunit